MPLPMNSKEIKAIANGLLDDEAQILAKMLALRGPQPLDGFAERGRRAFLPEMRGRDVEKGQE